MAVRRTFTILLLPTNRRGRRVACYGGTLHVQLKVQNVAKDVRGGIHAAVGGGGLEIGVTYGNLFGRQSGTLIDGQPARHCHQAGRGEVERRRTDNGYLQVGVCEPSLNKGAGTSPRHLCGSAKELAGFVKIAGLGGVDGDVISWWRKSEMMMAEDRA